MKFKEFLLVLFFYTLAFSNSYSIEPDVFVQSTVNRASSILSKDISKEDKIDELKIINFIFIRIDNYFICCLSLPNHYHLGY